VIFLKNQTWLNDSNNSIFFPCIISANSMSLLAQAILSNSSNVTSSFKYCLEFLIDLNFS